MTPQVVTPADLALRHLAKKLANLEQDHARLQGEVELLQLLAKQVEEGEIEMAAFLARLRSLL